MERKNPGIPSLGRPPPRFPLEITEHILKLAILHIEFYPRWREEWTHDVEFGSQPSDPELPFERRYALTRAFNGFAREKAAALFARVCRRWADIARRLLYISIKYTTGERSRLIPSLIPCLKRSPLNASIITSLISDLIQEPVLNRLLPLLPNLLQLELCVERTGGHQHPFRRARFDHLQRLAIEYKGQQWGSLRSILEVVSTVSTLEALSLGSFSSDPNLDDQDDVLDDSCPIPSYSLKYLRLCRIRSLDYDLSPLFSTSTKTLHDLVLDDFDSAYTLSPSGSPLPVVHAVTRCYKVLERLTLRRLFDFIPSTRTVRNLALTPLLHADYELPSLQYLYWEAETYHRDEIGGRLLSVPMLQHLVVQHQVLAPGHLYSPDIELLNASWIVEALSDGRWPLLKTWSFETSRTQLEWSWNLMTSNYPYAPIFSSSIESHAMAAGAQLIPLPRVDPSVWRERIGKEEEFCERLPMLDLSQLLDLRRSHVVSHS
jgi:hypothetical protein